MNRLFPNLPKNIPPGTHVHALQLEIPDTIDQLSTSIKSFCQVLYESCRDRNTPLAPIMYGFVMADGIMPHICHMIAERFGKNESKMAISILVAMGCNFIDLEAERAGADIAKEGLDVAKVAPNWLLENNKLYSFTYTCGLMGDISCDCPACIMFWSGRQSVLLGGKDFGSAIKTLSAFIQSNKDDERHGPGCVKHLIKGSEFGKWISMDEHSDDEVDE